MPDKNISELQQNANHLTPAQFASLIDHTQVKPAASQDDIKRLCQEAKHFGFATVTVNSAWVSYCAKLLKGSEIGIAACVGFPLGASTAHIKVREAKEALTNGATELDMVYNIGALKSGFPDYVEREIAAVVKAVGEAPVKVILETGYLTKEEKIVVCDISKRAGARFVKTATGFGLTGATIEDVALMRQTVGPDMGVKAAGGIRSYMDAVHMIEAGADRLGTSSSVEILGEMPR